MQSINRVDRALQFTFVERVQLDYFSLVKNFCPNWDFKLNNAMRGWELIDRSEFKSKCIGFSEDLRGGSNICFGNLTFCVLI